MSLRNCVDNFTRIQTSGTFPSTISKCKWLVLMLHKNEIWLAEKVQSFRDFTEYYFTSRLNKTPESRLKVRSQFSFLICFFTYDQCVVLYMCWANICLRRRFRTCELSLEEFSWKYGSKDGMSIEVRFVT